MAQLFGGQPNMPAINTATLSAASRLDLSTNQQVYCGLDSCITLEVFDKIHLDHPVDPAIYSFERALQGPYMEIMQRGIAVDKLARFKATGELHEQMERARSILDEFAGAIWDRPLNPRSPKQLKEFFYEKLRIPEKWISIKGERKLSLNREVLEKLSDEYLFARPFVSLILTFREMAKQLELFETEIDRDGRFRASYNIAGTETGRPSSSENAFGTGGNAQNIAPGLRYIFCSDPGYRMCVIDLEQVEARDVGFFCGCLFGDWKFLDNCESGDLHTNNAKLIWPERPWTGNPKEDKEIAEQIFYREFSFRDMAKRGGHLCLTEDHEVLTPSGWVSIVEKPSVILSFSDDKSSFSEVSNWTDESYSGEIHSFEGNSISALMTSEHRVPYVGDTRTAGPFARTKTKAGRAKDGPGAFMPLGWGYEGGEEVVPARLIAAFMSDGHQKSTNRMEFHFHKERKISRLKELCVQYGYTFEHVGDKLMVHGALPKKAGAFMLNWTKECIADFVDEYKHWDGHVSKTAVALFSVDKEQMEWLQTLGRIIGIGGQIKHSRVSSNFSGQSEKVYETDYYNLGQNHRLWASGKSIDWTKQAVNNVRVLCPTVSSGYFYVRRNGKIFVTGNSNYYGTAWTAARSLKVPVNIMEEFQARYIRGDSSRNISAAYPAIARWWQWTAEQLETVGHITTPFGRKRHFFGRPNDDTTLREAIAFLPQSTTADRMNLGLWKVWHAMPQIQLLAQTYDSITFQYPETLDENLIIEQALELLNVELVSPSGRRYSVPGEAKVGWNWGRQVTTADQDRARAAGKRVPRLNPDGLIKWSRSRPDLRSRLVGLARIA